MNDPKNKNTPNPTFGGADPKDTTVGRQSRNRNNAPENIKKTYPTKK